MSIFDLSKKLSLPIDPRSLVEGPVTNTISSGMRYGADPAQVVIGNVSNVSKISSATAQTLGPNFDRFSVLKSPQSFGVVGNLFESAQDLIPISTVVTTLGGSGNLLTDELNQIDPRNLLRNPKQEITKLAKNVYNSVQNEAKQATKSAARGVVQMTKDVARGAVNTLITGSPGNIGVTDARISYAFKDGQNIHSSYVKGIAKEPKDSKPEGMKGVLPIMNPHYVFRLSNVASSGAGEDSSSQSKRLLDKEFTQGVSTIGKRDVTLSAILSKFGDFSATNRTPYRAADFLWLKHYNRIPLNRLVTLRRYMFPINDDRRRSAYFKKGDAYQGWDENPVSQMVTYFGGETGNSLSEILKISASTTWGNLDSNLQYITLFQGVPTDAQSLLKAGLSSRTGKLAALGASALSRIFAGNATASTGVKALSSSARDVAIGALAYAGIIDPTRATGIAGFRDTFNPYAHGGYFQDLYQEPYNVVKTTKKRVPGLSGGFSDNLSLKFEYSLKSIGHINAKAAMLDIMANVLATCHYRGKFWGGEARFFLNKGIFPLLDEGETLAFVKSIWTGDYNSAVKTFENVLARAFGTTSITIAQLKELLFNAQNQTGQTNTEASRAVPGANIAKNSQGGDLGDTQKNISPQDLATLDVVAGLFGLTDAGGNPAIPAFQALKTGAPIGEWHLTVGNPFKPIAKMGNLVCNSVDIQFNDELGSDDFPTEMSVTVGLTQGMPRANQDIESVFNNGNGALYLPKAGNELDVQTAIDSVTAEAATTQVFDFVGLVSNSTIQAFSTNFQNNSLNFKTPHIAVENIQTDFVRKR